VFTAACSVSAIQANPAPRPPGPEQEIVSHYLGATQTQQDLTRGSTVEMDIDASVPSLQKQGKLHALKNITKLGKITFHVLGFTGDNTVKTEVIAKYLKAEVDAAQNGASVSITPDHYKFKYKGIEDFHGHQAYVLRVTPREKKVGLFKGELWLDSESYMPVRESGSFVKTPSVFLKKMQFVREYAMQNGVYVPQHMESKADVRFIGPVQLNINYLRYSKDDLEDSVATGSDQQ
jgi:Outer membrane lipoprotein-sorting protein